VKLHLEDGVVGPALPTIFMQKCCMKMARVAGMVLIVLLRLDYNVVLKIK
jgi:hypothetical protein